MKFMTILLGLSLLATPAMAAPKKKPAPTPPCITVEAAEKMLVGNGFKIEHNLTGDALAKLNRAAEKKGASAPEGQTALIIASHPKISVFIGLNLVKGCVSQSFPINPELLKKLMNTDDGSI